MNSLILSATVTALVVIMISTMMYIKEMDTDKSQEKMGFECGFMNMNPSKMNYSTNFIMIIILFLVFDLEASIMVPMIASSMGMTLKKTIPTLFLTALTAVLVKEWSQGAMEWAK